MKREQIIEILRRKMPDQALWLLEDVANTIFALLPKEQYKGRPNPRDVNPYDSKAIRRTQRRKTY